ncbi:geranylgeranyl reductase family protein [Acidobacteriota bacterium]
MNKNIVYDAAVVGGGPVGAATAYYAAKAGLKTILFEKEAYPRDKLCGGALSPRCLPLLGQNVLKAINCSIEEIRLFAPFYRCFNYKRSDGNFVIRKEFDQVIARDAEKAGTKVLDSCPVKAVKSLSSSGEYEIQTGKGTFRATYVVLATGVREKAFLKTLGFPHKKEKDYMAITVESETTIDNTILKKVGFSNKILAIFFGAVPNGYGWYFVKEGYVNIGIGATAILLKKTGARKAYHRFVKNLKTNGFLPENLELAKERAFPLPFKRTTAQSVSGKVLRVGDSAGFVSPVSGEGLYYGLKGGQLAAEAIARHRHQGVPLTSYQESWEKAFGRDLNKYGYFLREAVYKSAGRMELAVTLGRHDSKMALLLTRMLYGEITYGATIRKALTRLFVSLIKMIFHK